MGGDDGCVTVGALAIFRETSGPVFGIWAVFFPDVLVDVDSTTFSVAVPGVDPTVVTVPTMVGISRVVVLPVFFLSVPDALCEPGSQCHYLVGGRLMWGGGGGRGTPAVRRPGNGASYGIIPPTVYSAINRHSGGPGVWYVVTGALPIAVCKGWDHLFLQVPSGTDLKWGGDFVIYRRLSRTLWIC